jgi:hypothetical protein
MIFDCVQYWPNFSFDIANAKSQLPVRVQKELVSAHGAAKWGLMVESPKRLIVSFLDSFFSIGTSNRFTKIRYVEITRDELPRFEYYHISPRVLEEGKHFHYETNDWPCSHEFCPIGNHVITPYRIKAKLLNKLDFARVARSCAFDSVDFVLSAALHESLKKLGAKGMDFQTCMTGSEKDSRNTDRVLVGKVAVSACRSARGLVVPSEDFCSEHLFALNPYPIDPFFLPESIPEGADFFIDNCLRTDNVTYRVYGQCGISRRVLEVLLNEVPRGLMRKGWYFREKFVPIVMGTCDDS